MRILSYVFGESKPKGYFSLQDIASPFFIMGGVLVAYFNLLLFGFAQKNKVLFVFSFSEFRKPVQHGNFLWDLSQANNRPTRTVNP